MTQLYGAIQKVDAEQRLVWGYASTEAKDTAGEIVRKSALEGALKDYLEWGNIREMHKASAVGVAEEATVDDKGLYLCAKVVDDAAWAKVQAGVYKGFSIGGKVLGRDTKSKNIITKLALREISLVDRPCNPEARFDVWKAADIGDSMPKEDAAKAVADALAKVEELKKGQDAEALAAAENELNEAHAALDAIEKGAAAEEGDEAFTKGVGDWLSDEALAKGPAEEQEALDYFAKRDFSAKERKKDAKSGAAMKDGSFPIENESDLKNAIKLAGHASNPSAARAHIKSRAKSLGLSDMIPDTWKAADAEPVTSEKPEDSIAKALAAGEALQAAVEAKEPALEKGMYALGDFAQTLQSLAYLVSGSEYERDNEGDNSKVPEKLRKWVGDGIEIFMAMAAEETAELLAYGKTKKAAEIEDLAKAAEKPAEAASAEPASDALAKAETATSEALAKIDAIAKELDESKNLVAARDDALIKVATVMENMTKRIAALEATPMPPKTAGPGAAAIAVEKGQDASAF